MTAFYMFRMWFMTFMGEEGHATQHCHGESPKTMTVPLMILSVFAVLSGFLIMFGLDGVVSFNVTDAGFVVGGAHAEGFHYFTELFTNPYTYLTIVLALLGIGIAYLMYAKKTVDPGKFNKNGQSWIYKLFANRWYFPEFYKTEPSTVSPEPSSEEETPSARCRPVTSRTTPRSCSSVSQSCLCS